MPDLTKEVIYAPHPISLSPFLPFPQYPSPNLSLPMQTILDKIVAQTAEALVQKKKKVSRRDFA
ncbi:MAG: hypothetical protein ACOC2C_04880, partial [Cyclonatronaceae bacterium]